ncbi:hypothetical protein OK006_1905 [Actinobacteria bacterium OK006]|nr:hypothetical protein OK006_1905 [Actinobacteria bacterium OK006]
MADPDLARQLTVDAAMAFNCAWPDLRAYPVSSWVTA